MNGLEKTCLVSDKATKMYSLTSHSHTGGQHQHNAPDYKPQTNASIRAAFIHVIGDLFQSISVLISALIIYFKPQYKIADPICTFIFSIFVLATTVTVLRDILIVLMEESSDDSKRILNEVTQNVFDNFPFHSVTIQVEPAEEQNSDGDPGTFTKEKNQDEDCRPSVITYHCHSNNTKAHEARQKEHKIARKKLYIAAVICLGFIVAEIA
ncbi:hypothetical protein AB205_0098600, partial [Aquarana catesbeiana]